MIDESDENEDDSTPVEARKSTGSMPAAKRCPGCSGTDIPCLVCFGDRFTQSTTKWAVWEQRIAEGKTALRRVSATDRLPAVDCPHCHGEGDPGCPCCRGQGKVPEPKRHFWLATHPEDSVTPTEKNK
jgi:hypothetical protein